jgi:hypothetical protein
VSAKQYVELLMVWVEEQLNDESIFPSNTGKRKTRATTRPSLLAPGATVIRTLRSHPVTL